MVSIRTILGYGAPDDPPFPPPSLPPDPLLLRIADQGAEEFAEAVDRLQAEITTLSTRYHLTPEQIQDALNAAVEQCLGYTQTFITVTIHHAGGYDGVFLCGTWERALQVIDDYVRQHWTEAYTHAQGAGVTDVPATPPADPFEARLLYFGVMEDEHTDERTTEIMR
ncbi:MAG: hypothetical protein NVSMB65_19030 [Chloroflexota bacterium]